METTSCGCLLEEEELTVGCEEREIAIIINIRIIYTCTVHLYNI